MNCIISGSTYFQNEYLEWIKHFTNRGYNVIDYPRLSINIASEYPDIFKDFFNKIEHADIFFLFNKNKNDIEGYIGAASFSELTYAVVRKILYKQDIDIYLFKKPSEKAYGYDEVMRWLKLNYISIY